MPLLDCALSSRIPLFLLLLSCYSVFLCVVSAEDDSPSGRVCMTVELYRAAANDSGYFYECAPLADDQMALFNITDRYVGIWKKRDCPEGHDFDEPRQKCIEKKKMKRQQAACAINPTSLGCASACQAPSTLGPPGTECNWLVTQLYPVPSQVGQFFQCSPQSSGSACGEWVVQPCQSGAIFNPSAQVCVPNTLNDACGSSAAPVCQCAPVNNACPGSTSCQQNVCCQSINGGGGQYLPPILAQPQNQGLYVCPGSNVPPLGSCSQACPQYTSCQPGIGCCPYPVGNNNPANAINVVLCPGTNVAPMGSCSAGCASGTSCQPSIGGCCPQSNQEVIYNVVLLCPNGQPAGSACGPQSSCPSGSACFQGACCQSGCPSGQTPIGFCQSGNGMSCMSGGSCYQPSGSCCVSLPTCSNGVQASTYCTSNAQCSAGQQCTANGCCSLPFCPNGVQASAYCTGNTGCSNGQGCYNGACCPMPSCSNSVLAMSMCSSAMDCSNGATCVNGGCCPFTCPGGVLATQSCGGSGCPLGQQCNSGSCCPLPLCPSGQLATSSCAMGAGCSSGQGCFNGVCCSLPTCSMTGTIATGVCGLANSCPIGQVCDGMACCPEPLPLCPNAGRAAARCTRGADCPPGFGCSQNGGCCPLALEPMCPQSSPMPVCQCSSTQQCPNGASCSFGTCCASSLSYNQVPGSTCQTASQCGGYSSQCAACATGVCSCINGAASNGASCVQYSPNTLQLARRGCDQYGSPCTFVLSTARRRPLFAPVGNTTEPLFFNVAEHRRCVMSGRTENGVEFDPDSSCLPNEKCIDGKCRMKLWPGEYGCETDDECIARCPNTYCEQKRTDRGVPQCQCREGLLLYGRCFERCPAGFHESGTYCMYDDEEAFWSDAKAQDTLRQLLNDGQC